MTDAREDLSWEHFGTASRELAVQVAESGYEPDLILSSRGAACSSPAPSGTR